MKKIEANDGSQVTVVEAVQMWEAGEFSDWVEAHGGFPIEIDGVSHSTWEGVEGTLSVGYEECHGCGKLLAAEDAFCTEAMLDRHEAYCAKCWGNLDVLNSTLP